VGWEFATSTAETISPFPTVALFSSGVDYFLPLGKDLKLLTLSERPGVDWAENE
jgi:hypothetical protein